MTSSLIITSLFFRRYCDKLIAHCMLVASRTPRHPTTTPVPPQAPAPADGAKEKEKEDLLAPGVVLPEEDLSPTEDFDEVIGDAEVRREEKSDRKRKGRRREIEKRDEEKNSLF